MTDFSLKPPYDNGDLVIPEWMTKRWKRITPGRVKQIESYAVWAIDLWPVRPNYNDPNGKIIRWVVTIKCLGSNKIFTGIPADGYIKVPKPVAYKYRGETLATSIFISE